MAFLFHDEFDEVPSNINWDFLKPRMAMNNTLAIRMQIACNGVLVAECIVQNDQVDSTWARFVQRKRDKGIPVGGMISGRADLPRYWNVPVGSAIWKGR